MILGTAVSCDGCITEYKQAVTQCTCREALQNLIIWKKIFIGVYKMSRLITVILTLYIYQINFYPLDISAIPLIPILIIYFNISHVIQPLCMQSATSVDHTSSAQLHTQFNFSAQHQSAVTSLSWINSKAGSPVLPYSNNKQVETAEKRCWVKMGMLTG